MADRDRTTRENIEYSEPCKTMMREDIRQHNTLRIKAKAEEVLPILDSDAE